MAFDAATLIAAGKCIMAGTVFVMLGIGGWRATATGTGMGGQRRSANKHRATASPAVIAGPTSH